MVVFSLVGAQLGQACKGRLQGIGFRHGLLQLLLALPRINVAAGGGFQQLQGSGTLQLVWAIAVHPGGAAFLHQQIGQGLVLTARPARLVQLVP